jgi:hypothetical protein
MDFFLVAPKPWFLSSSKIRREIFWELVPCIEVILVFKFHPIWCHIAQESSLERKGWILGENCVFGDLLPDIVWS